jgi:hypothetical protein
MNPYGHAYTTATEVLDKLGILGEVSSSTVLDPERFHRIAREIAPIIEAGAKDTCKAILKAAADDGLLDS